jgi:glycosyltransferase involved in cell wall biosynthesis
MTGRLLAALLVIPSARLYGGGDVWLGALLAGLGKHGVAVTALFEEDGELACHARMHGCTAIIAGGGGPRRDPGELVAPVAEVLSTNQPQVTVFWSPRAQLYGAQAHALAGRPGRTAWVQHVLPSRFWLHQAASESPSDLVICVSRAVQERQVLLYPQSATAVCHPGVNVPDPGMSRAAARRSLGIPPDRPVIGVVGRIEPWKGQDVAVRMLDTMSNEDCWLVLVGDRHSASWPEFAPEVDTLAARLGLGSRVLYPGHRSDAAALVPGLDVLVCASREEGFGLSVVEAMAAGVPVAATRCGGPEDVIEHEVSGLLVPPENPVALGRAVERLLASPSLAGGMAARAKARYSERFTGDLGAARFAGILRMLTAAPPDQAPLPGDPVPSHPGKLRKGDVRPGVRAMPQPGKPGLVGKAESVPPVAADRPQALR